MTHRPLKFVIPHFAGPDNFADNVSYTLRAMGHSVIMPDKHLGFSGNKVVKFAQSFLDAAFPLQWTKAEKWAVHACRQHKPDILLCLTQSLKADVLEAIRQAGVMRMVAWWGDTPANMSRMGLLTEEWDNIYLKDVAGVRKFQALGLPAHLMHEACNPVWHRKMSDNIGEDIVVAGSYYGYRQAIVSKLMAKGLNMALYGPRPPAWSLPEIPSHHRAKFIVKEVKSKIFGEGLACLNSTALSEGDSLNCRAFEIAGAWGLQLIEDKPSVTSCFEPGKEILTYKSVDDICHYLERAQKDPKWAKRIRDAGYKRAHRDHSYQVRLTRIINELNID